MDISRTLVQKKRTTNSRKGMISLLIILLLIVPTITIRAEEHFNYETQEMLWKYYPYQPPGTDIVFPNDEGAHDSEQFPIEWWYANFHLIGQTTGNEYGAYVAFYKLHCSLSEDTEFRIFSISDITNEQTYTNIRIGTLTANTEHLDLCFEHFTEYSSDKSQQNYANKNEQTVIMEKNIFVPAVATKKMTDNEKTINTQAPIGAGESTPNIPNYNEETEESPQYDYWFTKTNGDELLPFQYTISIGGDAQQDAKPMRLSLDMNCITHPLIVNGDGIVEFGQDNGESMYFSLTDLNTFGNIVFHDTSENVIGSAWLDHQWGNFANNAIPLSGLTITYEWFSIKLDDNREIMMFDAWDRITGEKIDHSITGGMNIMNSDGTVDVLEDFIIITEETWYDQDSQCHFASEWHISDCFNSVNLTIVPLYPNQMMHPLENNPRLQAILAKIAPGLCLWEGVCSVTGSINNIPVNGRAYVELTHHCVVRDSQIMNEQM